MDWFFAKDWPGPAFELFGTYHLTALGLIVLANLAIAFFHRRFSPRARTLFRYTLAALLIIDEIGWHYWHIYTGTWTVQEMLPLHLCSMLVFLSAFMLVTRNYRVYEFAYFMGIAGATQALLTPDAGAYGFPHFRAIQCMLSHGCIVTAAIYMTVVEGYRPTWKSMVRVAVEMNLYMAVVYVINVMVGGNYLYVIHKPATASLLDVLGPWPWYILVMEAIGFVLFLLLYLPFALRDLKSRPQPAAAHPS